MTENSAAVRSSTTELPTPLATQVSDRSHGGSGSYDRELADTAELLVRRFANLDEGPQVFHHAVRLADAAVPALERFVRGPCEAIYQSRSLGIDALAAIGTPLAVQALTRALQDSVSREPDPVCLEAESVLVNHIAEHLSRFRSAEVTEALLSALQRRPYPYCAATLGLTGDHRAIPLLIQCLFDDTARPAAAAALQRFAHGALRQLTIAALDFRAPGIREPPTHVLARAAAVRLIGKLAESGSNGAFDAIARALRDPESAVRWESALALAPQPGGYAAPTLEVFVAALGDREWSRVQAAADALIKLPGADARIIRVIGARARSEEERRRRLRAVGLAGKMQLSAAVPGLRTLATVADPKLRLAAVSALGHIDSGSAESIARFLTDREPIIRQRALQALRGQHALSPESATAFLGDEDPDVRRLADDSVCDDLEAAWPALQRAALHFGEPGNGMAARFRLWWHACALLIVRRKRHLHGGLRSSIRARR